MAESKPAVAFKPVGNWRSISEYPRYPDEPDYKSYGAGPDVLFLTRHVAASGRVSYQIYHGHDCGGGFHAPDDEFCWFDIEPIAWQPLPEMPSE